MQPLIEFNKGDRLKIIYVNCGFGLRNRLIEFGLFDGVQIEIVSNDRICPILVKVMGSKIALGRGEASKIYGEAI